MKSKKLILTGIAAVTVTATAAIGVPLASASSGTTGTSYSFNGTSVNIRTAPNTSSDVAGSLQDEESRAIHCWTHGETAGNPRGEQTDVWFQIDEGYVSGAFFFQDDPDVTVPQCEESGGDQGENLPGEPGVYAGVELDAEQVGNARTIMSVAKGHGFGRDAQIIALMTAMQESQMYNLDYGDRDSQGLFQQRPETGWGTVEQVRTPVLATRAFFGVADHTSNPGLRDIEGWESMRKTEAAQAVQRSAFPEAYAKWEEMATAVVDANSDVEPQQ